MSTHYRDVATFTAGAVAGACLAMLLREASARRTSSETKEKSMNKNKKQDKVGVGIGVVLFDKDTERFLVGLRTGSHGEGQWALPGGWLEPGESFVACARRELEEETGITEDDVYHMEVINVAPSNNLEFKSASVFVLAMVYPERIGNVKLMEPHKCKEWIWVKGKEDLRSLPMFFPLKYFLDHVKRKLLIMS